MERFAEVLLPLPLYSTFTYSVPEEMLTNLKVGSRVLVSFGRRKQYTAIVVSLHNMKPEGYEVKPILEILDSYPIVRHSQLKLWNWISEYYLASPGDVYKAAVPTGLKIESETFVEVNPDFEVSSESPLSEREIMALDYISTKNRVQISELCKATGLKNIERLTMRLLDRNAIVVSENVVRSYKPKTEIMVTLNCERGDNDTLHAFFDKVQRSKKQEQMLLTFLEMSHWIRQTGSTVEVSKIALLENSKLTDNILNALCEKGIMKKYRKEVNRFIPADSAIAPLPTLTTEQKRAYREILDNFLARPITLLHGVTSSGKTEIYIHVINEMLRLKRQVLYLVPEIALTAQLTTRLHKVFGDKLLIYHSKFSDNERVDIWKRLINDTEPCVVIGARSAVFLPFGNLGLVIVDEEHDTSYKQQDPAPRYNGRNVAMMLAMFHGAKTLLGSATPSIESYYNASEGRYGLVKLSERYQGIEMPEVEVVDTTKARKKKEMNGAFSSHLVARCKSALDNNRQVILFRNRRGFAPMVVCKLCGWVPKCDNCDVSLTYHKHSNSLSCHYCGFTRTLPVVCPACQNASLEIAGFGTERIEEETSEIFPDEKILRMDLDTTRNKNSYEQIIDDFSEHHASILVGTQMVTKGLDFGGVGVVGVLSADTMLDFPDFRSQERTFNMLEQVAGRAGRKGERGKVVIQTAHPDHPVIESVTHHDYEGYYNREVAERKQFGYPPYSKIIDIYLKHRDEDILNEIAVRYSNMLRSVFSSRVLGPEPPLVKRVQQFHIRHIMLKMELQASMPKVKKILRDIYEQLLAVDSRAKSIILYYDVDPM